MEIVCSTLHHCQCLGDSSLMMHELRVMEAVEFHLIATYHVQHFAFKSVFQKSQSGMGGKLFSYHRTVFELRQGL